MNKQILKDAKKALKDLQSFSVPVGQGTTNTSSTNADDIFSKASSMDSSSADSIIDNLNNLSW